MSDEDYLYYRERAETEIELARRADHPRVVAAHYYLAESYLELIYGAEGSDEVSSRLN
jgi:hypothetical protein